MKLFIGTSNKVYQSKIQESMQNTYNIEIMSSEEHLKDALCTYQNPSFSTDQDAHDIVLVMLDYQYYLNPEFKMSLYQKDHVHFAIVLLCDVLDEINLEKIYDTNTVFMIPMKSTTDLELQKQINLLAHNFTNIQKIQKDAFFDPLTNIRNRRAFFRILESLFVNYKNCAEPFCLGFIDLDHFKVINDTFGHIQGDKVLSVIAKIMQQNCRKTDVLGRIGGEEFAIIFPNTTLAQAYEVLERIRHSVEQTDKVEDALKVTLSAGLVSTVPSFLSYNDMISSADLLLYKAKDLGRNQICM